MNRYSTKTRRTEIIVHDLQRQAAAIYAKQKELDVAIERMLKDPDDYAVACDASWAALDLDEMMVVYEATKISYGYRRPE